MVTQSVTHDDVDGGAFNSTVGKFDRTLDWSFRIWIRTADTNCRIAGCGDLFSPNVPQFDSAFGNQNFIGSGGTTAIPGAAFSASVWTFLAATHNSGTGETTIYRKDEGSSMQSTGPFTDNTYTSGTTYDCIVVACGSGDGGIPMAGDLAGFALWTAFLSSVEIASEASYMNPSRTADLNRFYLLSTAATSGNDTSGNGYNATGAFGGAISGITDGPAGPNIPMSPSPAPPTAANPRSNAIFFGAGTTS